MRKPTVRLLATAAAGASLLIIGGGVAFASAEAEEPGQLADVVEAPDCVEATRDGHILRITMPENCDGSGPGENAQPTTAPTSEPPAPTETPTPSAK